MRNIILLTFLYFLLPLALIFSQSKQNESIEIETYDGNIFLGEIIEENDDFYKIVSKDGIEIVVPKSSVKEIQYLITTEVQGEVWRPDPNKSMYLFAPSAYPIENNKQYCRDFCLFFPSYNRGIGNNISVQAGAFVFPGGDFDVLPIILSGKYSFPKIYSMRFATGIMYFSLPLSGESIASGITFGTATFGNKFKHFSASLGWGYSKVDNDWEFTDEAMLVLASNLRVSNTLAFVSEFWKFPSAPIDSSPLMVAGRFIGRKMSVDLGFILVLEMEGIPPPIINFTYYL